MPTYVKFYKEQIEEGLHSSSTQILAVFPGINEFKGRNDTKLCYSHVGQHGQASVDYYRNLPEATKEEYKDLKKELESIGYKLKLCR